MGNAWQGVARSEAPPLHMPSPIQASFLEEDAEEVEDEDEGEVWRRLRGVPGPVKVVFDKV